MENRKYAFYGWEKALVQADSQAFPGAGTPRDLYDVLLGCWDEDTCAPRMRKDWSKENPTLGQCSITSFLVQDIYGGKVYGVPLPEGGVHCYNDVGGCVFDLTSEQFGGQVLCYTGNQEQFREDHFADGDKKARYELLRDRLVAALTAAR